MPTETHEYSPGIILPTGLVWTIPAPAGAFDWDLRKDTGRFKLTKFATLDWITVANNLAYGQGAPSTAVPGEVTFDIRWSGVKRRFSVDRPRDDAPGDSVRHADRYQADGVVTGATMEWSGTTPSQAANFKSEPGAASTAAYAAIWRERNGIFYDKPSQFHALSSTQGDAASLSPETSTESLPNTSVGGMLEELFVGGAAIAIGAAAAFLARRERYRADFTKE